MVKLSTGHLKTGEELQSEEILNLIEVGIQLKKQRKSGEMQPLLAGKTLAMIFDKPSLRTRLSFSVAMTELGGHTVESVSSSRKQEEPEDVARVLSGYCHGIMVRTHEDRIIERMASAASIPVINALSELHHPCQILADLMTLQEVYGKLEGLTLSYFGDGNNILHSLLLMAPKVGVNVKYACPKGFQPNPVLVEKARARAKERGSAIISCSTPQEAASGSHALYTDVWTSMGFEAEKTLRDQSFHGYQVNEALLEKALLHAVVMHCLPMERGKEISKLLPDGPASVIFQQSENRLHIQKAVLIGLMGETRWSGI